MSPRHGPTDVAGIPGRVLLPDDSGYDEARRSWNRLFSHRPAAIVYPGSAEEVVDAVAWARGAGVALRIRGGGHCLEGWSTLDDGLVIDLSGLDEVTVDGAGATVTVGAGITQGAAVAALAARGLTVPTGTEGSVGLAGATLGGGFGLLTRRFGMACDALLRAEVVVASADGGAEVIEVDAARHPELLWALRGAGNGSFGVVTSLNYRVHPLTSVVTLTASWEGHRMLADVFDAWQRSAPVADERLTSQLEIRPDAVVLIAVLASGDAAEVSELLDPMLSLGSPEVAVVESGWAEAYGRFQVPLDAEPANWKFASQFVSAPFPRQAVAVIAGFMASAPTSSCNYFTNALGGAVRRSEPAGGSAFAHRDALFYAEPGAGWGIRGEGAVAAADDPLTPECLAWVAEFAAALEPFVSGAYPNVPNPDAPGWEQRYWGVGVDHLRAVKARYDPSDVFRFPQSVRLPADS